MGKSIITATPFSYVLHSYSARSALVKLWSRTSNHRALNEAKRKGLEHSTFADWFCFIEKYVGFAIDKNRNLNADQAAALFCLKYDTRKSFLYCAFADDNLVPPRRTPEL